MLDYLRERGILDDAITIVTSDHGENFLDHPRHFNHGFTVYQTAVRGVGLIRLPGAAKAGTRVPQLVSNIDILPTLLSTLGLEIPPEVEGEAIDITAPEIIVLARTRFSQGTKPHKEAETDPRWYNIRKSRCIIAGDFKYVQTPYLSTEELYDLSSDPWERDNLLVTGGPEFSRTAARLRRQLQAWADSANPLPQPTEPQPKEITDDTIKRLKSLGYIE